MTVIEPGQIVYPLSLSLEGQKQYSIHKGNQKAVKHDIRIDTLNDDT